MSITLDKLAAKYPDIIDEILDETAMDNGYWIYLKDGYWNPITEVHNCHGYTVKQCLELFRMVEPELIRHHCANCGKQLEHDPDGYYAPTDPQDEHSDIVLYCNKSCFQRKELSQPPKKVEGADFDRSKLEVDRKYFVRDREDAEWKLRVYAGHNMFFTGGKSNTNNKLSWRFIKMAGELS